MLRKNLNNKKETLIILLCGLIVSFAVWGAMNHFERKDVEGEIQTKFQTVSQVLKKDLSHKVLEIQRMAERWESNYEGFPKENWEKDAENYCKNDTGYQAIEWVDSDGIVRWVMPKKGGEKIIGFDNKSEEGRRKIIEKSKLNDTVVLSDPIDLVQGGKGVLIFFPLYIGEVFDGYIVAVLNVEKWIHNTLDVLSEGWFLRVIYDNQVLCTLSQIQDVSKKLLFDSHFNLLDRNWTLQIAPNEKGLMVMRSNASAMAFIFSIFMTILVAALFLWNGVNSRNVVLAKTKIELEKNNIDLDKARQAALDGEEKVKSIIENTVDALVTIDSHGIIQTINKSFLELFRCSRDDAVIGKNINMFMPQSYRKDHDRYIQKYLITGVKRVIGIGREIIAVRKDGLEFPAYLSVSEFHVKDEIMFTATVRNLTNEKKAEADILKAKQEAEDAQVRAEISARTKGEFLANMSHEIRTPMNGIIGMSRFLSESKLDKEQKEFVNTIVNSSEGLLSLVNAVLDHSKIEAGKLKIEKEAFDLKVAVEDVSRLLLYQAEQKNIELIVNYDPSIPRYVRSDSCRIKQVLTNLMGNAIKFTEKGYVKICVGCFVKDDIYHFDFVVEDCGIGLPEGKIDELFEKFSQADVSTARKFGGTGLGLSISTELVSLMSGIMTANNRDEGGAAFNFILPMELGCSEMHLPLPMSSVDELKILIVDDDRDFNNVLKRYMIYNNCKKIVTADSGGDALNKIGQAMIEGDEFNVVIVDQVMGQIDGTDFGIKLKNHSYTENMSLIMLTANPHLIDNDNLKSLGFSSCIAKPVELSQLIEACLIVQGAKDNNVNIDLVTVQVVCEQREIRKDIPSNLLNKSKSKNKNENKNKKIRVLIVEDNLVNQKVARRSVEKLNFIVDIASNGQEAIDLVEKHEFDIVLMDMHMPKMDGLTATRKIRNELDKSDVDLPIIAMTANVLEEDVKKCLDAGMNAYLSKPLRHDLLCEIFNEYLQIDSSSLIY